MFPEPVGETNGADALAMITHDDENSVIEKLPCRHVLKHREEVIIHGLEVVGGVVSETGDEGEAKVAGILVSRRELSPRVDELCLHKAVVLAELWPIVVRLRDMWKEIFTL